MESVDHVRGYASVNVGSFARIRVFWGRFDVPLVVVVVMPVWITLRVVGFYLTWSTILHCFLFILGKTQQLNVFSNFSLGSFDMFFSSHPLKKRIYWINLSCFYKLCGYWLVSTEYIHHFPHVKFDLRVLQLPLGLPMVGSPVFFSSPPTWVQSKWPNNSVFNCGVFKISSQCFPWR